MARIVPTAGLRHIALAAFWFSVMSMLVKLAGERIPSLQIVLVRAVVTLVMSYFLIRRASLDPWGKRRGLLVLRGLLGLGALACFYFSLVHMPLADATVIHYTNPVFTALLASIFLNERLNIKTASCIVASLAGVVVVARPAFMLAAPVDTGIEPVYMAAAVAAAVLSAGAYVAVRKLGRSEEPLVVVFYFPLVTVPLVLPFTAMNWVWPTATEWLVLLGVGVSTQIAQVHLTRGLAMEPAGKAMTMGYLQIIFAAVWGMIIFSEVPDLWTFAGAAVVILSVLALARSSS